MHKCPLSCQISSLLVKQCTKCYKFLYTVEYSVAPGDPVRPSSINMGGDVQQGPLYKAAKFRPLLKTPL